MTKRWLSERRQEKYYRLAKKYDYRSRASFKLMQMDDRFGIFREGDSVVDLGASPGGWLQVAKERVGDGIVVGVDLRPIRPIDGVITILGDITSRETVEELLGRFGGKADVLLSDMAPDIGGNYSTDHARSVHLCMFAVAVAEQILRRDGKMVMKVFMGDMLPELRNELEKRFQHVRAHEPPATRDSSSEVYLIGTGFKALPPSMDVADRQEQEEKGRSFTVKGDLA
jgi:23S rRNA (uridine2552-2'-O)-methyltransferase